MHSTSTLVCPHALLARRCCKEQLLCYCVDAKIVPVVVSEIVLIIKYIECTVRRILVARSSCLRGAVVKNRC